jgi:hypothetical protein
VVAAKTIRVVEDTTAVDPTDIKAVTGHLVVGPTLTVPAFLEIDSSLRLPLLLAT